jgi:hypothetical protein
MKIFHINASNLQLLYKLNSTEWNKYICKLGTYIAASLVDTPSSPNTPNNVKTATMSSSVLLNYNNSSDLLTTTHLNRQNTSKSQHSAASSKSSPQPPSPTPATAAAASASVGVVSASSNICNGQATGLTVAATGLSPSCSSSSSSSASASSQPTTPTTPQSGNAEAARATTTSLLEATLLETTADGGGVAPIAIFNKDGSIDTDLIIQKVDDLIETDV